MTPSFDFCDHCRTSARVPASERYRLTDGTEMSAYECSTCGYRWSMEARLTRCVSYGSPCTTITTHPTPRWLSLWWRVRGNWTLLRAAIQ